MKKTHFLLQPVQMFRNLVTPEKGSLVGYGAVIEVFDLKVLLPDKLALISMKTRRYSTEKWEVFTPRHKPNNDLFGHLTFAIRYEGINLSVFKSLFKKIDSKVITDIIKKEPSSKYSRKIWFLYEWLMDEKLAVADLENRSYIDLLDKRQYAGKSINSPRHLVRNNLPGTKDFCPLIRKTPKLEAFIAKNLAVQSQNILQDISTDMFERAAAFLLLKDSKSSFAIEGEQSPHQRLRRWGQALGQAGTKELTPAELLRLQEIVIQDQRLVNLGWRKQGGFVGTHDLSTQSPIPDHVSAKWQDVESLVKGLLKTFERLKDSGFDPVLAAALISFGFVFIHPLEDGNGRLHRYLIHHVLSVMRFARAGLIFPVSAAILKRIEEYRQVLEGYSLPLLELVEWEPTENNNIEVLNETADYYRYFDATAQAEFLYGCVAETVEVIVPEEIRYLQSYDRFRERLRMEFELPEKTLSLLVKFLQQGEGQLTQRAKDKEFAALSAAEVKKIERVYEEEFGVGK